MVRKSPKNSMNWNSSLFVVLLTVFFAENVFANKEGYYGKYIGKLSQLHHGVSGDVFAVDARTLHLRNFNYDGEGPAAYFYAGNSKTPGANGFRLRDERGTTGVLPKYRNKHITITLPEGKTLQNIKWFSVWCDEFAVNFGDVKIPKNLDFPKPQKISGLSGVHGVSSEPIVIVDAQTLLIPSFSYDGEAPDAKFWVGPGFKPTPQGIRIPDENGKEVPLRRYDRKTIVLTLPGELTIFDIGHFGVWCEAFTVDFGHVQIPRGLNIPPSLKMLGVSPQKRSPPIAVPLAVQNGFENQIGRLHFIQPNSKLNCEVLWDDFAYEVRWAVAGDSIVLQLVARLENNEYMSFGLSGDKSRSRMVGGDVVVAWVDKESLKGFAEDYYLDAKSQCSGERGSCPDENIAEGTGSVRLLNAALVNGYSIVTFQRSLRAQDEFDKNFLTNESQPIIWAIGPLNSRKEVSYHSLANRGDIFIDFGRAPKWNCPTPESTNEQPQPEEPTGYGGESKETRIQDTRNQESNLREPQLKAQVPTPAPAPKLGAWEIPPIKCYEPEDGVFYAQMGPTGGKHGYSAITGHVGWGISWYINGLLIPEINVVRGRTYTFIVEGGLDPETPARYHPFYITDDPVGGYQYKTPEERLNIQIFAGAVQNKRGEVRPTGVGRLCNWTPDPNQPPADEFASFGAYQRTLRLECDPGNPGIIQWTVEKDTPDTVYYQCYTHRYLGWKINVHDSCESEEASEPIPSISKPPKHFGHFGGDSDVSESVQLESRVIPNYELLHAKNETKFQYFEKIKPDSGLKLYEDQEERLKIMKETTDLKNQLGLKNSYSDDKVKESNPVNLKTAAKPAQPFYSKEGALQQQSPQYFRPSVFHNDDEKSRGIYSPYKRPDLPLYGVTRVPFDKTIQSVFQNFQILPVPASLQNSKSGALVTENLNIFQKEMPKEKTFFYPTTYLVEQPKNAEKLEKYFVSNHFLRVHGNEKFKKPNFKLEHRPKVSVRLTSVPKLVSQNLTRQSFPKDALPQFPPELIKPTFSIKLPKESTSTVVPFIKAVKNQHLNHRLKFDPKGVISSQQKGNSMTLLDDSIISELKFAQNTGFNPESVKVEGGFKPILSVGETLNINITNRADHHVGDDSIMKNFDISELFSNENSNEKTSLLRVKKEGNRNEALKEKNFQQTNLFKNQSPQSFEPIFVPSFPDYSFKNFQESNKKKQAAIPKRELDNFQYPDSKKRNIYTRIRSNFNSISRSFSPDFPIKTPFDKGSLQSDFQNDSQQINQDLGVISVIQDSATRNNNNVANILEVLEGNDDKGSQKAMPVFPTSSQTDSSLDEIAMADEIKEFYIPARPDKFLAYDGKVVRAEPAPTFPESDSVTDVSKLPQFVPYKGAIPPLGETINAKNLPQLKNSKLARQDILPPTDILSEKSEIPQNDDHSKSNDANTKLSVSKKNSNFQSSRLRKKRFADHGPAHDENHNKNHLVFNYGSATYYNKFLLAFVSFISLSAISYNQFLFT